jgi:hypothetical protein
VSRLLKDIEEPSNPIADVEPDGNGVPILIRPIHARRSRIGGFSLDPAFHTLDLILADLRLTPPAILSHYRSKAGAAEFLRRTFLSGVNDPLAD